MSWVLTSLLVAASAAAEPSPPTVPASSEAPSAGSEPARRFLFAQARRRYDRGVLEKDDAALAGALDALALAYALWPESDLLFNMAQVQRHRGLCSEARRLYERYLEGDSISPERQELTRRHLTSLESCRAPAPIASSAVVPDPAQELRLPSGTTVLTGAPPVPLRSAESNPPRADLLPWVLGGVAAGAAVLAGMSLVNAASADARVDGARSAAEVSRAQTEGEQAQLQFWIFGSVAAGLGATLAITQLLASHRGAEPEESDSELLLDVRRDGAFARYGTHF